MALALGEARKALSADALFRSLRSHFGSLPDPQSGEVEIPLADALMSAFAMFSLKDPSLLAFDHRRHNPKDNFRTIYGINRVPWKFTKRRALYGRYHPKFADFQAAIQEILDGIPTTYAEQLETLMTLNFQQFEDVSLMAA